MDINQIRLTEIENKESLPVVMSYPVSFSIKDKNKLMKASKEAGLKILDLIKEPVAAAFAYILNGEIKENYSNIVVFDFGFNKTEVSILNLNNDEIKISVNEVDNDLGGEDITDRLFEYLMLKVNRITGEEMNYVKMSLIRQRAEEIKISLSSVKYSKFEYDIINEEISRELLNNLCYDIFKKAIDMINKTINKSKISSNDIKYIILAGGSSKIKRIEELIRYEFEGVKICNSIRPNEVVSVGCALYCKNIQDNNIKKYKVVERNLSNLVIVVVITVIIFIIIHFVYKLL